MRFSWFFFPRGKKRSLPQKKTKGKKINERACSFRFLLVFSLPNGPNAARGTCWWRDAGTDVQEARSSVADGSRFAISAVDAATAACWPAAQCSSRRGCLVFLRRFCSLPFFVGLRDDSRARLKQRRQERPPPEVGVELRREERDERC